MEITLRAPRIPEEIEAIAELIRMSGGGLFEFLYEIQQGMTANRLLEECIVNPNSSFHCSHCTIAEVDGCTAGVLVSLPSALRHTKNLDWLMAGFRHLKLRNLPTLLFRLLSVASYTPPKGSYNIQNLAVFSAFQGKGVGNHLLHKAESFAFEKGFSVMTIEVWKDNIPAVRLYEKAGFVPFREIKKVPRHLDHRSFVLMKKYVNTT